MFGEARAPKLTDYGDLFMPSEAAEPILARPVRAALLEWLTEIWAADELKAVGLAPRRRAIFDGPPGVGKTTMAHHLAARLGLPMLAVRPERIIDCWVGSTGRNIGGLFDAVKRGLASGTGVVPVVLFIDEFDALAGQRRQAMQAADNGRQEAVDTLLQRLEQHQGFLIAATNYAAHIDQAIWRRFDIHITLALPGQGERERILARYLAPYGLPAAALTRLADALDTASPALMRALCENLKRQIVLGPRLNLDMRREAAIERILASCHPHPDLGKPRLWTLGAKDQAVASLPWPLPLVSEVIAEPVPAVEAESDNVVPFGGSR